MGAKLGTLFEGKNETQENPCRSVSAVVSKLCEASRLITVLLGRNKTSK
jgi:hypothetical protein